ncbi:MAG: urease subunit gamma [Acidimicrobiales bacterium]|jgi:urease subunit gamma/beta
MHISPAEEERALIFTIAQLARRRRTRGSPVGAQEAIALVCDEVLEAAWDGQSLQEIVTLGRSLLGADDLLDGVPALVRQIQVEAMTPSGSVLVSIDEPFGPPDGDGPGAVRTLPGMIELNAGSTVEQVQIRNTGQRRVVVSSHFPLAELNAALVAEGASLDGKRLAIPAGASIVFEPGDTLTVPLIPTAMAGEERPPHDEALE